MKLKTTKRIINILAVFLCIFAILNLTLRNPSVIVSAVCFAGCIITVAAMAVLSHTFYRCPHCRRHFKGLDIGGNVESCPHCGKEIDTEAVIHRRGR